MNRFLYTLALCLFALPTFSQQRNSKGQKMVSKVEVFIRNTTTPFVTIDFGYNNTKLNYVSFKTNERQIVWNKSGNTLKRAEYDENTIYKKPSYEYTFNEDGLISTQTVNNFGLDGSILRFRSHFLYDEQTMLLTSIHRREFHRFRGKEFVELSDRYEEAFGYKDGNMYSSRLCGYNWKTNEQKNVVIEWDEREYNKDLQNDTNIDFYQLYRRTNGTDLFEMVTEWINCRSDYLIERYIGSDTHFDYTFDNEYGGNSLSDDKGNIVQMDVYQMGRIDLRFKIYYLQ